MTSILPGPGAGAPPALTDHLLEEIFVRIASPADLVRASAACVSFRPLIADPTFLRRYRSLHPPLLLGIVGPGEVTSFLPAEAPHPDALAARAADFSFDYLPDRGRPGWHHCDAHDGRLLMCTQWRDPVLPELAVCDPLTRRYTLLPQMPDCLVASTLGQVRDQHIESFDAFFVPWVDYNEVQFRVIGWAYCEAMAAVFVYAFALRQLDCWYFYQLGCSRLERATRRLPTIELVAQLCVWLLLLESDLEQHVAQARH